MCSGEVQSKATHTLKMNSINAIDRAYFAIDQLIPNTTIQYNQGSPRATNNHHSDQTSTAVHNTNGWWQKTQTTSANHVKKAPEIARQPLTTQEMRSAERKPNLAQAISTKAQKQKEGTCATECFRLLQKEPRSGLPAIG
jgi:hypothetical protein